MKYIIVTIYDRKVGVYGRPAFVRHTNEALRQFIDEANRKAADNILNQHTEDFDLYQIGTFEDEDGLITPQAPPDLILAGQNTRHPGA